MKRRTVPLVASSLMLFAAGCGDSGAPELADDSQAFATLPLGFSEVQSTFGAEGDDGTTEWTPRARHGQEDGRQGMVCGGLGRFFRFGFGLARLAQDLGSCAFDAASGRIVCDPITRNGLTIERSAALADAEGNVQQNFLPGATNSINFQVSVSGTRERRDGNTSTVQHSSDHTVAGLAEGSTQRTINGTSEGTETTTGSDEGGDFTATRKIGDSIENLTLPARGEGRPIPTAGKIVRLMEVTFTYQGQPARTSSRREEVTFDGSDHATVVITRDGQTRTCQWALPGGPLSCPS